jgi:uncharacterized protein (TIGR02646 family)
MGNIYRKEGDRRIMRPVDKGTDRGNFTPYQDAQQPLQDQLGEFCSYCERWISSGIHVEHKLPKNDYPNEEFKWTNFLLSCPNCNSGKGAGQLNLADYLWPDSDNTFLAFEYDSEGRVLISSQLSEGTKHLAESTWKMVGLNKHPDSGSGFQAPSLKDKRWLHRQQAWAVASGKKKILDSLSSHPDVQSFRDDAASTAVERGMFSVWMAAFDSDPEMKKLLIQKFQGTATDCFDCNGMPVARQNGQL